MNEELERIDALLSEDYEPDEQPPKRLAVEWAKRFLEAGYSHLKERMPKANFITPDLDGGLRIEYKIANKHLRLLINPKQINLYWQDKDTKGEIATGQRVLFISKLVWLTQ